MAQLGNAGGNKVYLTIYNGKLARKVPQGTPDAISRINKNGVQVHELLYPSVTGYITGIYNKESKEYGDNVNIVFDDEIIVSLYDIGSSLTKSVLNSLIEADFSKEITLSVYLKDDKTRVSLWQNDELMPWAVTKEDDKGCPQPVQEEKTVKGKLEKVWNWDENDNWWYNKLLELEERLKKSEAPQPKSTVARIVEAPEKEEIPEMPNNAEGIPPIDYDKDRPSPEDLPF